MPLRCSSVRRSRSMAASSLARTSTRGRSRRNRADTYTCLVNAAGIGSPLDARLEVYDAANRLLAENDDAHGVDPELRFTAPADGVYQVRIRDSGWRGGQAYVYRLTIALGPVVDRVFPLGGRRGASVKLDLVGHALPASTADVTLPTDTNSCIADVAGKTMRPIWLDLDDVPEAIEGPDVSAGPLPTPVMLNGRIGAPGEIDSWSLAVNKGEPLTIEMRAARLGSPLDAVVVIRDAADKEVARVEGDKSAEWTPAADGVVRLLMRDRFHSRGGPAFAYRVKVSPGRPDFRLTLAADAVSVLRKGQAKIKIDIARLGGFKDPIAITAENLPDGVTALPLTANANQTNAELTLKADENAPVSTREIRIHGTPAPPKDKAKKDAKVEAPLPPRTATVATDPSEEPLDTVLLGVGLPTPFVIKGEFDMGFAARGGTHRRSYKILPERLRRPDRNPHRRSAGASSSGCRRPRDRGPRGKERVRLRGVPAAVDGDGPNVPGLRDGDGDRQGRGTRAPRRLHVDESERTTRRRRRAGPPGDGSRSVRRRRPSGRHG